MKKEIRILMIDDHPMILEGYKRVLQRNTLYNINIETANDADSAVRALSRSKNNSPFDLVFIDIQIPESTDKKITSGEDLAQLAVKLLPNAKIVFLTMINHPYRLLNLIETIPHHGVMVKNDISAKNMLEAFYAICSNQQYYSKTVARFHDKYKFQNQNLDEQDKKILFHLSNGVLTKNLSNHIPLSLSSIEKRKNRIKQLFNVRGSDEDLLIEAKKRGYI